MSYFTLLGEKRYHLHIPDSNGVDATHLVPGEGVMPYRELVQEIRDLPFEGTATIELVTNYLSEPRLYARRSIENLRSMLAE